MKEKQVDSKTDPLCESAGTDGHAETLSVPDDLSVEPRKRGGPRTVAGKLASRRNGLKHGLTATKLINSVLPAGRVAELRDELLAELAPRSTIERLLVNELARHAAMLELGERAELAVLRRGAIELAGFRAGETVSDDAAETFLAAAVASDAVDRFARYRRGHEKALQSALRSLGEFAIASRPNAVTASTYLRPHSSVWIESQCEEWLRMRATTGHWSCPACDHTAPNWLTKRRVFQCKSCRHQCGLRIGTVMAGSPLPLAAWFTAIGVVVNDQNITAAELGRRAGIERAGTAQRVLDKIRDAMTADDADRRLAGLARTANGV
jgi:hypothetical protein